jgi:diguanylate cyclase (GGDEF)-like protein
VPDERDFGALAQRAPLAPEGPTAKMWGFVTTEAAVTLVALVGWASRPAPVWTPPTGLVVIVPIFVCAVAAVGFESRKEAIRAGQSSDGVHVDSCGMVLLLPALLLSFAYGVATAVVLAVLCSTVLRRSSFELARQLASWSLGVVAAAFVASSLAVPGNDIPAVFSPVLAGAGTMWAIEAAGSSALSYLEHGRAELKALPATIATASRFVGVCAAFILLYIAAPPLTLAALPLVALVFSEQRIRHLLDRRPVDDKTGLATSATFTDRLNEELRRAERTASPVSIVVIDLDHFKAVNTNFGHLGGDQALAQVADTLTSFRRGSDLVARWGGDELVWLMPGCPRDAAASAAEAFRKRIAETAFSLSGQQAALTVSIGVAAWLPGVSSTELFRRADEALFRSKEAGRNTCSVDGGEVPSANPWLASQLGWPSTRDGRPR